MERQKKEESDYVGNWCGNNNRLNWIEGNSEKNWEEGE